MKTRVQTLLKDAVDQKIGSGIAASFGNLARGSREQVYVGTTSHSRGETVDENTFFDLASLTKIIATTSLYMKIFEHDGWYASDTISMLLPEIAAKHPEVGTITLEQLLSHSSGLPAHQNVFEALRTRYGPSLPLAPLEERKNAFYQEVMNILPEAQARSRVVYSDIGFLWLTLIAERKYGQSYDQLIQNRVWNSFSSSLHYRPVVRTSLDERYRIERQGMKMMATELCPWRGLLVGQVHDDNCWSMGGVAGHAGVFGRLNDVEAWMDSVFLGNFVSYPVLQKFFKEQSLSNGEGTRRTLGFDMAALDGSGSTAYAWGAHTIGHLGFTGTSLWVDLDSGDYAILLTNRVHPSRNDLRIRRLRRQFHTLVRKT